MHLRVAIILAVLIMQPSAHGQTPAKQPDEPEAIKKGLDYVESKSLAWLRQRKCASCHHVPMMVWAQRDARERGEEVLVAQVRPVERLRQRAQDLLDAHGLDLRDAAGPDRLLDLLVRRVTHRLPAREARSQSQ